MKGIHMTAKANAFDVGDYVVYPKHGVGRVIELQEQEIAGMQLELYVLRFEKERMTLRVPTSKVEAIGMRKLSSDKTLREALETLKGKPRVKRTMWSRRAQEYEAKINSGDLVSIAEVTRDLFRADVRFLKRPHHALRANWRRWKKLTRKPHWARSWRS
jgi:CarD family transcriptional regulator